MAESAQYSRSVIGASDEIKEIYCEPCGKDGLVALADGYCKDCHEYLCTQCYKTHRRNKMLANHVLLDKNSMPITSGYKKGVLDICKEKCTIHSDKVIELFCETCDKLGCTICITIDHRQCRKVKHIPDIAKDLKHSQEFTAFQECIKSTTDKLSEFEQKVQANVTSNTKMEKLARQELQRQRAEVNKFFDELEKKVDDEILTIETRNKDTLKKASDKLKPMNINLDQIKNDIEEKKSGQNCELFISMKKSKEKMKNLDDQVNIMHGELTIQHYTLIPSEQIQAMMKTTTEICRIQTARTEISRTPSARTTTEIIRTPPAKTTTEFSRTPPTATLKSVIDIKSSKDKTQPSIDSLIIMHGHYCVVADNDNDSIKVVDTKSKHVESEIGIKANYWSLTMTPVSDDQFVVSVTLSDGKDQIQFFSVSTSGVIQSTDHQYYVNCYYMDMVHCKDNIYGISCIPNRIDILSMTGRRIRTIKTDDKGIDFVSYLAGIALSFDRQTIYVTNCKNHSVTSLSLGGKVNAVYTDKDLKDPWGITVDRYGYVYVRSRGTKNVLQLTADLHRVQILIKNVDGNCITYSSTTNKLYINDNDKIYEYIIS